MVVEKIVEIFHAIAAVLPSGSTSSLNAFVVLHAIDAMLPSSSTSTLYAFGICRRAPFIGSPAITSGGDGGLGTRGVERLIASERCSMIDT